MYISVLHRRQLCVMKPMIVRLATTSRDSMKTPDSMNKQSVSSLVLRLTAMQSDSARYPRSFTTYLFTLLIVLTYLQLSTEYIVHK